MATSTMKPLTIKAITLKAAHESADLKHFLNERVKLAESPEAIWHDAKDVFAEIEARNAFRLRRYD